MEMGRTRSLSAVCCCCSSTPTWKTCRGGMGWECFPNALSVGIFIFASSEMRARMRVHHKPYRLAYFLCVRIFPWLYSSRRLVWDVYQFSLNLKHVRRSSESGCGRKHKHFQLLPRWRCSPVEIKTTHTLSMSDDRVHRDRKCVPLLHDLFLSRLVKIPYKKVSFGPVHRQQTDTFN